MKGKNKGITLIALIITIIVMLILVGVTISVALNGGMFTKADEAAKQTQKESDKEELSSAIAASIGIDGKLNLENLKNNLPEGWTENNGIYTSPKGKTYTLDSNGKIVDGNLDEGGNSSVASEEDLKKYILGADGKGRAFFGKIFDRDEHVFLQDPENSDSTIHEKIKLAYWDEGIEKYTYYIRYDRNVYKFQIEGIIDHSNEFYDTDKTIGTSFEKISTAEGNLGKYVEYAGNTWIVLRDNASGVELITADTTDYEVTLGGSNFDTAKESYNNAVEKLIQECKNVCKEKYGIEIGENVIGIRCVGGPAEDKTKDTDTIDFTTLAVFKPSSGFPYAEYTAKNIKIGDKKYLDDYNQMKKIGILASENMQEYWLASRFIQEYPGLLYITVQDIDDYGNIGNTDLIDINSSNTSSRFGTSTIRPVITLTPGILKNAIQAGTIDDPIILN